MYRNFRSQNFYTFLVICSGGSRGGSMGSMDPPFHRKSLWLRICKGESTVPLAGLDPPLQIPRSATDMDTCIAVIMYCQRLFLFFTGKQQCLRFFFGGPTCDEYLSSCKISSRVVLWFWQYRSSTRLSGRRRRRRRRRRRQRT